MDLPPEWGVIIGMGIGSLVLELIAIYTFILKEKSPGESQKMATASIIIGLLFFVPFIFIPGLILGIWAYFRKEHKKFAKVGIWINGIVFVFYLSLIIVLLLGG
ncbi:hypothetical protein ACFLZN_01490 [Nanoarchaeota archaeon]